MSSTRLPKKSVLKNQRGQGLIEYLIIVALMGVATIAIMRVLSAVINSRFETVSAAVQGDTYVKKVSIPHSNGKSKDLGNFFDGAASRGGSPSAGE